MNFDKRCNHKFSDQPLIVTDLENVAAVDSKSSTAINQVITNKSTKSIFCYECDATNRVVRKENKKIYQF